MSEPDFQAVGSIETIPFRDDMKRLIIEGKKTATSRSKRYLYERAHDSFIIDNTWCIIQVTSIERKRLGDVALNHYKEEGFESSEDFIKIWKEIHPGKGYRPLDRVYFHKFIVLEVHKQ
jgi:hypothetical protein